MIIKSMSRKEGSFSQLLNYMEKGSSGERAPVFQNLHGGTFEEQIRAFEENAELLQKRKNGVVLYHEILSFKNNDTLDFADKAEKLQEIASEYLRRRSKHSLAYGVIHEDKSHHTHVHLCISSNALGESKRVRQSKAQFQKLKIDFEKFVLEQYPELGQNVTIDKEKETTHTRKGGELKRRTGKLSQKEKTIARFRSIFEQSMSKEAFFSHMAEQKLEVYTRGNTVGFQDLATGRKYRLKTLGLDTEFSHLSDRLDLEGKRQVIDYGSVKGQRESIGGLAGTESAETPPISQEDSVKNPFKRTEPVTEKQNAGADVEDPSSPTISDGAENKEKKFGRFGTLKEWVTGDFTERTEYQKKQSRIDEEAKRQARYDARYSAKREAEKQAQETARQEREKETQFSRVQQSTKERVRRSAISAEVEARKKRFNDARDTKGRDTSKDKDGPDR